MLDILRKRRSIRRYKDTEISPEVIEQLKEAVLRSPSSRGINPWRFVFVTNRDLLDRLSQAKRDGSSFLKDARLGVVVCADQTASDTWIEDCSIASIILQLTGQSLDLGSCWIQIRNRVHGSGRPSEEYVRDLLGLSEKMKVESIISFGYPDEDKEPLSLQELEFPKIQMK